MKVRLLPGGPLGIPSQGVTLHPGDERDLPRSVVDRNAGRFEVLEGDPVTFEAPDVSKFHVGGGWYQVPGADGKVRRAEAELLIARA